MRQRRRATIAILLGLVALLGVVLFASVRPSSMFSIATPPPAASTQSPNSNQQVFGTTISNTRLNSPLNQVSGTTLLEQPRYTGQDATGRNWTVEAETALQGGSAANATYMLQQVKAEWADPSRPEPLRLTATEGTYNQASSTIHLTGQVQATGMGLTITAPVVSANLTTRFVSATGHTHTTGHIGRNGKGWNIRINAPTLTANPSTSTVLFTGGVQTQLVPIKE